MERAALRRGFTVLAGTAVAVLVASGCGQEVVGDDDDLVAGKTAFVEKCGSCHKLARAGTKGVTGPDLDAAFARSEKDGLGRTTIRGVVEHWITYPARGGEMPARIVEGQDVKDVAAYVASVAAAGGEDEGLLAEAGKPRTSSRPIVARDGRLEIPAAEGTATAYASTRAQAEAGRLEISMPNRGDLPHDIDVEGNGVSLQGEVVNKGGTSRVSGTFRPGTYTYFCSVPGHREGGMEGRLTVR